ncbi:hypothetical protein [Gemmatimonas groenlandica]|uniref:Uncharacterized protein n=1 Tax=Gemmatimonas groenlandica TaxID=2732249 RepID=A0A6M4ISU2_9BACT|nr:hypothetical protein [Gemmatimonas groenlandica]QJR36607.1 hypothetical protein HKW67_14360 [Gemmatimonas groenlandica]
MVQQQPASTPAPPTPPAAPQVPIGVTTGLDAAPLSLKPLTAADVDALKAKRSELSRQLSSVQGRRDQAAKELARTTGPGAKGLEQRLAVQDERIIQLERDIAANGRELARVPGELANEEAAVQRYGPFSSGQLTAISIVSIVLVWGPLAWAAARIMFKRAGQPKPSPQLLEGTARLERIEQAVDAMSIEIERISEGQRFVTQLMSSKAPAPALVERTESPA